MAYGRIYNVYVVGAWRGEIDFFRGTYHHRSVLDCILRSGGRGGGGGISIPCCLPCQRERAKRTPRRESKPTGCHQMSWFKKIIFIKIYLFFSGFFLNIWVYKKKWSKLAALERRREREGGSWFLILLFISVEGDRPSCDHHTRRDTQTSTEL